MPVHVSSPLSATPTYSVGEKKFGVEVQKFGLEILFSTSGPHKSTSGPHVHLHVNPRNRMIRDSGFVLAAYYKVRTALQCNMKRSG
jgi:diadenosine tetraphosphate (Ap4A) HIT family hydrolase